MDKKLGLAQLGFFGFGKKMKGVPGQPTLPKPVQRIEPLKPYIRATTADTNMAAMNASSGPIRLVISYVMSPLKRQRHNHLATVLRVIPESKLDGRIREMLAVFARERSTPIECASTYVETFREVPWHKMLMSWLCDDTIDRTLEDFATAAKHIGCSVREARAYRGMWESLSLPFLSPFDTNELINVRWFATNANPPTPTVDMNVDVTDEFNANPSLPCIAFTITQWEEDDSPTWAE